MFKPSYRLLALALATLLLVISAAELLARTRYRSGNRAKQQEILQRVLEEPDVLINADANDIPATADLVLLGNRATPALVNCLINNLDPYARAICAHVLVATRDGRATEPLLRALDDPNRSVRLYALQALGEIEARPATQRLLEMLNDENLEAHIRREVIKTLGRGGDPAAIAPLLTFFEANLDANAQLALWDMRRQLTPEQLQQIILPGLYHSRRQRTVPRDVRTFALERAGDFRMTEAVDPIIALYANADSQQRNRIVYNLGRIGDPRAIDFLLTLVDTRGEARLLNNVIFALQRLNYDVADILRTALTDPRAYIRYNAAFVAGDIREGRLLKDLVKSLTDVNDIVRSEAAIALGKVSDPQAIAALEKAVNDDNPVLQRDAFKALLAIDYDRYRDRAVAMISTTDVASLRNGLIEELGKRRERDIISPIILALNPDSHRDAPVGIAYLNRFGTMDNPDAIAFLVRAAANDDHHAFRLLGRFADPRTEFLMTNWLANPGREAPQILRTLARLGATAAPSLATPYLERNGTMVQLYAAFYFASRGDAKAMELLLEAIETAPLELKVSAAMILTELDFRHFKGAQERLERLLQHPDTYVRLYAARPLAHWGVAAGADQLVREIDKKIPFIQDVALSIIDRLPEASRRALLQRLRQDADPMLTRDLDELLARSSLLEET